MIMKFERNESKKKWWDDDLLIGSNIYACSNCTWVRVHVSVYVCMCVCVTTFVRMYVHLPHSPRAQLLLFFQAKRIECSDQWEKSKKSLRLLRIISYWSNWRIMLIKLIDTSMQLNLTLNNISQCDLILHYMIWFHGFSSASAIQRQTQEMDL